MPKLCSYARPPRVIHVVESLHRGAVESWLVRMLRHGSKKGISIDWTFYCTLGCRGDLDSEVRALGSKIKYSSVPIKRKTSFLSRLRRELKRGRYDILHCHHDLINALYLFASLGLPIKRRVAQIHNADENVLTPSKWKQQLLREPMRRVCLVASDRLVGISNHTLDTFLGGRRRRSGRDLVHYYGIDTTPFARAAASRRTFRELNNLDKDARILLFAGRIVPEKNPVFAVEVLACLRRLDPRAILVFAGSGSEEQRIVTRSRLLGVENSIRFLGWRNDLPEVMSCSDWFILPRPERPMEGFGMAVVEAQLAGLRLLLSQGIAPDPLLPTASYRRLSLRQSPAVWADAALRMLDQPPPSPASAQAALKTSPMDMDYALDSLLSLYA